MQGWRLVCSRRHWQRVYPVHQARTGIVEVPQWLRAVTVTMVISAVAAGCGAGSAPTEVSTASDAARPAPSHSHSHSHAGPTVPPDGPANTPVEPLPDPVLGPDGLWRTTIGDSILVSAYPPGAEPTEADRQRARAFAEQVRLASARFSTLEAANAMGYRRHPGLDDFHLVNEAYTTDGAVLDPTRPEFVMFDPDTGQFLGVMFFAPDWQPGPQFGGPLTVWHYHDNTQIDLLCFDGLLPVAGAWDSGTRTCTAGTYRPISPEMLHVWLVAGVTDPFATSMQLGA
jgi:hypothetical protein